MCVRVDVVLVEQVSAAEAILMSKCEWKFVFRTRCALAATSSCILWVVVCWCCWCCWHHPYVYFCICRICANSACFAVGSYFFSIGSFFFCFIFNSLVINISHWNIHIECHSCVLINHRSKVERKVKIKDNLIVTFWSIPFEILVKSFTMYGVRDDKISLNRNFWTWHNTSDHHCYQMIHVIE